MTKAILFCVTLVLCFVPSTVRSQDQSEKLLLDVMEANAKGKFLQAITLLESQKSNQDMLKDLLGMFYSVVGDSVKANEHRPPAARRYEVTIPDGLRLESALEVIATAARGRQIVMINEAHDAPEHRAFIARLAKRLRDDGFTYYAMETLGEDPKQLINRGYPTLETGFYSNEPRYAQLIRDTLNLGFTPVSYESENNVWFDNPIDRINAREESQCKNLMERVFNKDPKARILVHVGLDHVIESPKKIEGGEILWLAARLKKAIGFDPLTIDQITRMSAPVLDFEQPAIALDSDGVAFVGGPYQGYVDMQVYHPRTQSKFGRPSWLWNDEHRKQVSIPADILPHSTRILVQAFYSNEADNAIPADQVLLIPNTPRPVLSLLPGSYRLVVQGEKGEVISRTNIEVN